MLHELMFSLAMATQPSPVKLLTVLQHQVLILLDLFGGLALVRVGAWVGGDAARGEDREHEGLGVHDRRVTTVADLSIAIAAHSMRVRVGHRAPRGRDSENFSDRNARVR
ncbi:hypothetical protein [Enhygromyxa salina]|uniref:hypothetical protein n=1 Tax=Enhygromyxa salina TaxID=215803 RepID=UPI0011BA7D5A|nr:hypothetical protein [Enhygromyxa salina]